MSEFFDIDPNALDREWVRQPKLYHKYATELADARNEFERAKTNLELVAADLDGRIRARPKKYDLEKVTEGAIKSAILNQPTYTAARDDMERIRHQVGVLQAAVDTLDQKKYALQKLVDLRLADYFSEPRTSADGHRKLDESATRRPRRTP